MRILVAFRRSLLVVAAGLLATLLVAPVPSALAKKKSPAPTPAAAAKPESEAGAADADQEPAKVKIERGAGGKKVYKIEGEIVIEGKIQKPEAFYVLQKSSINYDWHELKQEFVPKILDSVTKAPF
jgi:glutathione synthase/RimK-type ligase-like ATP-grasp enzyme